MVTRRIEKAKRGLERDMAKQTGRIRGVTIVEGLSVFLPGNQ